MNERYQVRDGSESGHCCFDASVVDTQEPDAMAVCECHERETAERIAKALNLLVASEMAGYQ